MSRIYKLSRTGLRLLYKIRHHKGHGIHSPFVFNLITKVIEEKTPYHKYEDIELYIQRKFSTEAKVKKYNRLSFRLVNYLGANRILEIGAGKGINSLYLTAPAEGIICSSFESEPENYMAAQDLYDDWDRNIRLYTDNNLVSITEKQDCILIDLDNKPTLPKDIAAYISSLAHSKTFVVVKGIRTNRKSQALWRSIASIDKRTAVLDLFNIGIVFFDTKLYRWDYQISF